jgi:hypothetical protein
MRKLVSWQKRLNGRRLHRWRGVNDADELCDALVDSDADLFDFDGGNLVWLNEGTLVPVSKTVLAEIFTKFVAYKKPVNRGPIWEIECCSFNFPISNDARSGPTDQTLLVILAGRELSYNGVPLKGGALLDRVPKATMAAVASSAARVVRLLAHKLVSKRPMRRSTKRASCSRHKRPTSTRRRGDRGNGSPPELPVSPRPSRRWAASTRRNAIARSIRGGLVPRARTYRADLGHVPISPLQGK